MKVNTKWNLGNFALDLSADVSSDVRDTLASLGLRYLGQRNTEVDKILGGFEKKGDKLVRRAGFKRNEVAFDPTLADALAKSFAELALPDSEETIAAKALVAEYQREAPEIKFRDAKEIAGRHESAGDLEAFLKDKAGYVGPTHDEEGEYAKPMLAAIHALWVKVQAAQKAGI